MDSLSFNLYNSLVLANIFHGLILAIFLLISKKNGLGPRLSYLCNLPKKLKHPKKTKKRFIYYLSYFITEHCHLKNIEGEFTVEQYNKTSILHTKNFDPHKHQFICSVL